MSFKNFKRFVSFVAVFLVLVVTFNFVAPKKYNFISYDTYANEWLLPAGAGGTALIGSIIEAIIAGGVGIVAGVSGGLAVGLVASTAIMGICLLLDIRFEDIEQSLSFLKYCFEELDSSREQLLAECGELGYNLGSNAYGYRLNVEKAVSSGLVSLVADLYNSWYLMEYGPQYNTGYEELNTLLGAVGAPSLPSDITSLFSGGFCFLVEKSGFSSYNPRYYFYCSDYDGVATVSSSGNISFGDFLYVKSFSWYQKNSDWQTGGTWGDGITPAVGSFSTGASGVNNRIFWSNRDIYNKEGVLVYDTPYDDTYVGGVVLDDFQENVDKAKADGKAVTDVDGSSVLVLDLDSILDVNTPTDVGVKSPAGYAPTVLPLDDLVVTPPTNNSSLLDIFKNFWERLVSKLNVVFGGIIGGLWGLIGNISKIWNIFSVLGTIIEKSVENVWFDVKTFIESLFAINDIVIADTFEKFFMDNQFENNIPSYMGYFKFGEKEIPDIKGNLTLHYSANGFLNSGNIVIVNNSFIRNNIASIRFLLRSFISLLYIAFNIKMVRRAFNRGG